MTGSPTSFSGLSTLPISRLLAERPLVRVGASGRWRFVRVAKNGGPPRKEKSVKRLVQQQGQTSKGQTFCFFPGRWGRRHSHFRYRPLVSGRAI